MQTLYRLDWQTVKITELYKYYTYDPMHYPDAMLKAAVTDVEENDWRLVTITNVDRYLLLSHRERLLHLAEMRQLIRNVRMYVVWRDGSKVWEEVE